MSKQYLLLAVSLVAAGASQAEGKFFTTVGVDYSSGEYGTSTKTTILSIQEIGCSTGTVGARIRFHPLQDSICIGFDQCRRNISMPTRFCKS